MAVIVRQEQIAADVFRLTLAGVPIGSAGQFVMVRLPDASMLLPRPISLFDADGATGETTLVYRVAGRGTKLLSTLETGALDVSAPRGAGYPILPGPAVLIGGGLGVAPLHLLACFRLPAGPFPPFERRRAHAPRMGVPGRNARRIGKGRAVSGVLP